ncbi:serine hydrolase [Siphonobacter sp. SORGH_AS_0500]|uniref:serine hydrolase n=1 Tax=Siphonobacter sp. SORGH_AS_0500 TaxID=1864824 RepID=UPI000CB920DC|nr:serine hydrolase [Siphonobacter sp. SORGH_AS_0500]PKK35624.1 serine hydrolase [Siphonobacter sp. SORGH_AS_0500]
MKWFFCLLFPLISSAQQMTLKDQITQYLADKKGTYAVAFKNLQSKQTVYINEHELFHAASTMKTPVMVEVYKQAAAGKFAVRDSILVKNEFKSIVDGSTYRLTPETDSEQKLYTEVDQKKSIYDLMYQMIIVSSNLATNIIIDLVGAEKVTKTFHQLGAKNSQIRRGVEDQKAYQKGLNNEVTAYDLAELFEKIAKGKAVNKESSKAMIQILLDQKFNDIIPAKLPAGTKVAHKTGSITNIYHDSGIVYLPDGRSYVIVLLSRDWDTRENAIQTMATISEMVYQGLKR